MTEILLADDHGLVLEGICSILKKASPDYNITLFSELKFLLQDIKQQCYDLYIIDLEFKSASGIYSGFQLMEEIRRTNADAKIIINTMHQELWTIDRLMKMNPNGIIFKSSDLQHIVMAVKNVLLGENYFCPQFHQIKQKVSAENDNFYKMPIKLTDREKVTLKYVTQGLTALEIAHKLFVTVDAVDYYKRNLYMKFGVKNSAELAALAVAQGWVSYS